MKDRRLQARLGHVLSQMSKDPERSIPTACKQWTDVLGAYRFFDNDRVEYGDVLSGHTAATLERMAEHQVILISQDTTFLNLATSHPKEDFGTLTRTERDEHLLHVNVAFTDQRVNLGVLSAQFWQRTGVTAHRTQRATQDKESQRWLDGYQSACEVQARYPDKWVISIADREGDIREWYEMAQDANERDAASFIVRAKQERRIAIDEDEQGYLWEWMAARPTLGSYDVGVAAKGGKPARTARVSIRAGEVTLLGQLGRTLKPVTLHAVWAVEEHPPAGIAPLRWMLLTDMAVATLEEARAIVEWYRCRWEIEVYFRVIKNACQIEALRLQTANRLYNAMAVYLIIAWRLHMLTMLAREQPDVPCNRVFSEQEWHTLYLLHTEKRPPKTPPTLRDATRMLAQQGGFLARKGDGEPGTKTIWLGYSHLLGCIKTIHLATKL